MFTTHPCPDRAQGFLSVHPSACSATNPTLTLLQLLKPPVPATTVGSGAPVQTQTLKPGSTVTDN